MNENEPNYSLFFSFFAKRRAKTFDISLRYLYLFRFSNEFIRAVINSVWRIRSGFTNPNFYLYSHLNHNVFFFYSNNRKKNKTFKFIFNATDVNSWFMNHMKQKERNLTNNVKCHKWWSLFILCLPFIENFIENSIWIKCNAHKTTINCPRSPAFTSTPTLTGCKFILIAQN